MNIVEACQQNKLPSLSIMCDYGLDGRDGINPLAVFDSYRKAVLYKNATIKDFEHALKTDTLKNLCGLDVKSGYQV
jgi:hypothetical protein